MLPVQTLAVDPVRSAFADDPDFRDLLKQFVAAMPDRLSGLREAHGSGSYDLLRSRAHQLKGAGGGYGFQRLSELAAELEQACRSQDPVRIVAALDPVIGYINRITV